MLRRILSLAVIATLVAILVALESDGQSPLDAPGSQDFTLDVPQADEVSNLSVAADFDGEITLVWQWNDEDGLGVYARRFGRDLQPITPAFLVNEVQEGHQYRPQVASDPLGNFMVTWQSRRTFQSEIQLAGRRFDAQGQPLGGAFFVAGADGYPIQLTDLAMAPGGEAMAVWHTGQPTLDPIRARRFRPNGSPSGPEFSVREVDGTYPLHLYPRVTAGPAGEFAVVWSDYGGTDLGRENLARVFEPSGEPRGATLGVGDVSGYGTFAPDIAPNGEGGFVVAWASLPDLPGRTDLYSIDLDRALVPEGPSQAIVPPNQNVSEDFPVIVGDSFGGLFTAWNRFDDQDNAFYGKRLGPTGAPLGAEIPLPALGAVTLTASPAFGAFAAWREFDTVRARRIPLADGCTTSGTDLCLLDRFRVRVLWNDPRSDQGGTGKAVLLPITPHNADVGSFYFFEEGNRELFVKMLDAREANGRFWLFFGALTDLEFWLVVEDTQSIFAIAETYYNPPRNLPSRADTRTFVETPANVGLSPLLPDAQVATPVPLPESVPLLGGRFRIELEWDDPRVGSGTGRGLALSDETAAFSFFSNDNLELFVKMIDGRDVNGFFWVFRGALTDVGYTLIVTDTTDGSERRYENPSRSLASDADTTAFPG